MSDYISREAAMEIVKRTSGDYAAAFSEIRKLPAADVDPAHRWIPCSERMPEDGQDVLIWDNIDKTSNGITKDELQHSLQWLFEHYQFDV